MTESIIIKNVGALRNVHIPDIKPLTVLIGSSASGKSTLMKIIALMRYVFKRLSIRAYIKNADIDKTVFYIRFRDLLRDGMDKIVDDRSFIKYEVTVNDHTYSITYENGLFGYDADIVNEDLSFFKEAWISEMRSAIPAVLSKGTFAKNVSLGFYFNETLQDFNDGTDAIKEFDMPYLGLKLNIETGGNNQQIFNVSPTDGSYGTFELKNASSGIQTTSALIVLAKYFSESFDFNEAYNRSVLKYLFDKKLTTKYRPRIELSDLPQYVHMHIEEPELSLDPDSQRLLISELIRETIYRNSSDRTVELIFATHSPYIINHLNVLIRASYYEKGRKEYPYINPESVVAYRIGDGEAENLMGYDDETGQILINTIDLSETMEEIYNDYEALTE